VHHHLRAIFRESNRERYYETHVAAKDKTVPAKEPRKPSRKLLRIRTKSLRGFRRRSVVICLHIILRLACPTALSLLRLQDKVQSVAEYAPEIADQLFHDEAIFMPRADYMEPLSFVLAVEATAVDVSGKWKREREDI